MKLRERIDVAAALRGPAIRLLSALSLLVAVPVFGVDEVNVSTGATPAGPGLAVRGFDVVSFFQGEPTLGSDQFAYAHDGATYRFVSQANLDAFKANPAKYEPAYGGFCAYGAARGKKFDGDPRYWKIVDGKLYLNLNGDVQAKWSEDIPANVKNADANWVKIRAVPVNKL
ncbi:MAG TPA: YHS domain-containing (seleno)protein [Candidatus Dormibacteraeota bacterium]|nr:YHS domain-containing (seleno)protein [Candidatus Dormibacteraeota bacterium]